MTQQSNPKPPSTTPPKPDPKEPDKSVSPQEQVYLDQLDRWTAKSEFKVYTPELGDVVFYYDGAVVEDDNAVAAIVTAIEFPGKVTLNAQFPQRAVGSRSNVRLYESLTKQERRHQTVRTSGVFRFKSRPSEKHLRPWLEHCERGYRRVEKELEAWLTAQKSMPNQSIYS